MPDAAPLTHFRESLRQQCRGLSSGVVKSKTKTNKKGLTPLVLDAVVIKGIIRGGSFVSEKQIALPEGTHVEATLVPDGVAETMAEPKPVHSGLIEKNGLLMLTGEWENEEDKHVDWVQHFREQRMAYLAGEIEEDA